jgi:hypothetical protein
MTDWKGLATLLRLLADQAERGELTNMQIEFVNDIIHEERPDRAVAGMRLGNRYGCIVFFQQAKNPPGPYEHMERIKPTGCGLHGLRVFHRDSQEDDR